MTNIIYFPGYLYRRGYYMHHGQRYRTLEALIGDLTQKDYGRSFEWDKRRLGICDHRKASPLGKDVRTRPLIDEGAG
jgi:hypothetical protein